MRKYWMRIALGALAVFAVGMTARALIQRGMGGVRGVVEGSGPVSIPLAFIPFRLAGEKLGTLERVTLERATPRHVTGVQLEVKLSDSLLARGLKGCRLAANLDSKDGGRRLAEGTFWCATDDSADAGLVEYGAAVFRPGDVTVPLLLPPDLVDELKDLDIGEDHTPAIDEAQLDSIVAASEVIREPMRGRREMLDSLRGEGRRRADSTRRVLIRVADSAPSR